MLITHSLVNRFRITFTLLSATSLGRGGSETRPYEAYRVIQRRTFPGSRWQGDYGSIY